MSFTPYIPSSGIAGWNFLQNSYDRQFDTFTKTAEIKSDTDYFLENIKNVQTSDDLLNDRRLLKVAVKAFGLEEEINYRALLQRALNEGTTAPDALANTMDDERYVDFSNAFGFGPGASLLTTDSKAMKAVTETFKQAEFEVAVGEANDTMRTALFAKRAMLEIFGESENAANRTVKENALADFQEKLDEINGDEDDEGYPTVDEKWESIFKQDVLMTFFDTTLQVEPEVMAKSQEEQIKIYRELAEAKFGSDDPTVFFSEENQGSTTVKFRIAASVADMKREDIDRTVELTQGIMSAMVAEEAALNDSWTTLMSNEYVADFMTVALGLPDDVSTRPVSEQMTIYRDKATEILGSPDPNVFGSEKKIGALLDIYEEAAADLGMSESEIRSQSDIAVKILEIQVGDSTTDTAAIERRAEAKAAAEEQRIIGAWYSILGQKNIQSIMEVTLGMPDTVDVDGEDVPFEDLELETQLAMMRESSELILGTDDPERFSNEYMLSGVVQSYRDQAFAKGESSTLTNFFAGILERELTDMFHEEKVDPDEELKKILESFQQDDDEVDDSTIRGGWYTIMGQQALSEFMRTALGLPKEIDQMDIDDQVDVYRRKANDVMGSENPSDFVTEEGMEKLVNQYLTRTQLETGGSSSNNYALMLLS